MINIRNITVFRGSKVVIENFSAQILSKEATLLTGPNGKGKTTLIQAIAGSSPLEEGQIEICGRDIKTLSARDFAQHRSVAPQRRFFSLAFSVAEVIHFIPESERSEQWSEILELLGITKLMHSKVTELSIGQQQRVSVALALIQRANFYLLDEPLSAQDGDFQENILAAISLMAKEKGVLVVSHNAEYLRPFFQKELTLK